MMNTASSIDISRAERIMTDAHALWRAQTLASAVEIGLFNFLETESNAPKTKEEICKACNINCARPADFLDCLVSMEYIDRNKDEKYFNTPESSAFLVKTSRLYIGGAVQARG